jgi:hypothetical protein
MIFIWGYFWQSMDAPKNANSSWEIIGLVAWVAADFSVSVETLNAVFDNLTCCSYTNADSIYQVIVIETETAGTGRAGLASCST